MLRYMLSYKMRWKSALCFAVISAALLAILSSPHLTTPGLYYDELHQATASFAYIRTTPVMFSALTIHGIPVLNMTYSGAIKTGIYGLFLRYLASDFSVISWRLLGIIFVSTGVFFFSIIAHRRLLFIWLFSFLFLFLTDITVVLSTRHDWGPTALALLFRLLFIAIWIHGEKMKPIAINNSFFLGSLVGIAIFEKLSSVVLVLPVVLIFVFCKRRRTLHHFFACIAGITLGGTPLILANLYTLFQYDTLISLSGASTFPSRSFVQLLRYIVNYISLGSGTLLKSFILGTGSATESYVEGILFGAVLLLTAIASARWWKQNNSFRMSGIMLVCYSIIGIILFILPSPPWAHGTWVNHWIIGTPFQYTAISFALVGVYSMKSNGNLQLQLFRGIFTPIVILLIISRVMGIVSIEKSFQRGDTSLDWDPSLSEMGHFASKLSNDAIFIASDWGVATQIFCLSNGLPDLVYEPFWKYRGPNDIKSIIDKRSKKIIYLVNKKRKTNVKPYNTNRILRDIETLKYLKPTPVEKEISELKAVEIRKFLYIAKGIR